MQAGRETVSTLHYNLGYISKDKLRLGCCALAAPPYKGTATPVAQPTSDCSDSCIYYTLQENCDLKK